MAGSRGFSKEGASSKSMSIKGKTKGATPKNQARSRAPSSDGHHSGKKDDAASEPQKIYEFQIVRLLPNLATVAALCTGLSAIRFALMDRFPEAVLAVVIAGFLDGIDGRIARLLNATSDFGAELDSLSDFISFGVAPAIVVYLASLHQFQGFGWGITLFYCVCMALRLARFNVSNIRLKDQNDTPLLPKISTTVTKNQSKFFVGVPAPAAAFIALLPLILDFAVDTTFFRTPYVYFITLLGAGLLMVSRIPTYSFKSSKIKRKYVLPTLIACAFMVSGLVSQPWMVAALLILTYVSTIPFSYLSFKKTGN